MMQELPGGLGNSDQGERPSRLPAPVLRLLLHRAGAPEDPAQMDAVGGTHSGIYT